MTKFKLYRSLTFLEVVSFEMIELKMIGVSVDVIFDGQLSARRI